MITMFEADRQVSVMNVVPLNLLIINKKFDLDLCRYM